MRGTRYENQRHLDLFTTSGPFELVAMHILGPLQKSKSGNQYVIGITERYYKLKRAITVTKETEPHVAAIFNYNWVIPYGIRTYMLTDNGPQIVEKLFAAR